MTSSPILLFVYGSLRTGEYNHELLARSTKICDASIAGFDLYSLGAFPAIVPSANSTHEVVGEVFEVDPTEFSRIDGMERGAGYTSQLVIPQAIEEPHEDISPSLVYVFRDSRWLHDIAEVVPSGDWVKRGE